MYQLVTVSEDRSRCKGLDLLLVQLPVILLGWESSAHMIEGPLHWPLLYSVLVVILQFHFHSACCSKNLCIGVQLVGGEVFSDFWIQSLLEVIYLVFFVCNHC